MPLNVLLVLNPMCPTGVQVNVLLAPLARAQMRVAVCLVSIALMASTALLRAQSALLVAKASRLQL